MLARRWPTAPIAPPSPTRCPRVKSSAWTPRRSPKSRGGAGSHPTRPAIRRTTPKRRTARDRAIQGRHRATEPGLHLLGTRDDRGHQPAAEPGRAVATGRRRRQDRHDRADRLHRQARRHGLPGGVLPLVRLSRSGLQLLVLEQGDREPERRAAAQLHGLLDRRPPRTPSRGAARPRRSKPASRATRSWSRTATRRPSTSGCSTRRTR